MTDNGYAGQILKVDLSDGTTERRPTADYVGCFIGGRGLATRLYWELVPPEVTSADDPANCLLCAAGPVAGFPGFAGSRWNVCALSPAGRRPSFSYGNLGGRWGVMMKYAGYDALAVRGKAAKPVYLFVHDGEAEIRDAAHLRGQTSFDAHDALKTELGPKVSVLTIGPAAENRVSFATIFADDGASGSGGMGAVMGAKNLKAICVTGGKRPVAAHPDRLRQVAEYIRTFNRKPPQSMWGLPGKTRNFICYGCGMGCDRQMYAGADGRRYKHFCQPTDTYQAQARAYYGGWHEVELEAIRLFDGYGLDTSVMKGMIAWLVACYKEGLLSEKDTGLPLSQAGSGEFIEALTGQIARREGFGDVLARGTIAAAASLGGRAQQLLGDFVSTPASETKDYDPRLMMTTALFYATEPRRPIQQLHDVVAPLLLWLGWSPGEESEDTFRANLRNVADNFWGGELGADFSTYAGKALAAKLIQDRNHTKESLVLCDMRWPMNLCYYPGGYRGEPTLESRIYSAITGYEVDVAGLNRLGEGIFNLQRAVLLRQGWRPERDDTLLDYFFTEPLKEGELFYDPSGRAPGPQAQPISRLGATVDREEFRQMREEYYQLRGWDVASGLPTRAGLTALGLKDVADDLETRGLLK